MCCYQRNTTTRQCKKQDSWISYHPRQHSSESSFRNRNFHFVAPSFLRIWFSKSWHWDSGPRRLHPVRKEFMHSSSTSLGVQGVISFSFPVAMAWAEWLQNCPSLLWNMMWRNRFDGHYSVLAKKKKKDLPYESSSPFLPHKLNLNHLRFSIHISCLTG